MQFRILYFLILIGIVAAMACVVQWRPFELILLAFFSVLFICVSHLSSIHAPSLQVAARKPGEEKETMYALPPALKFVLIVAGLLFVSFIAYIFWIGTRFI